MAMSMRHNVWMGSLTVWLAAGAVFADDTKSDSKSGVQTDISAATSAPPAPAKAEARDKSEKMDVKALPQSRVDRKQHVRIVDKQPVHVAHADKPVMAPNAPPATPPSAAGLKPTPETARECTMTEPEQPRGGRLELVGENFGTAPVVRIDGRPARMLERRPERIAVQIPPDSNGGQITLVQQGRTADCGTLTIIGKDH